MPTNVLRPEEWAELASALQSGDTSVGARLAERERRFDNYFQDLSGIYVPQIGQRDTLLTGNSYTMVATSATLVRGLRVGSWIMLNIQARASSSLTFGVDASAIAITLPPQLGTELSDFLTIGTFMWYDASGVALVTGAATPTLLTGYSVSDEAHGVSGYTSAGAGIGAGVNLQTSDYVSAHVGYNTAVARSLA